MTRWLAWTVTLSLVLGGCGGGGGGSGGTIGDPPAQGGDLESVAQERLVVQMDLNGDDRPDWLTLDTSETPFRIVEALEGAGDGSVLDVTDAMRGQELDAEISRALADHLASSLAVSERFELDLKDESGALRTVVVFE